MNSVPERLRELFGGTGGAGGLFLSLVCSSRSRHTIFDWDWSSDVCSSDLAHSRSATPPAARRHPQPMQELSTVGSFLMAVPSESDLPPQIISTLHALRAPWSAPDLTPPWWGSEERRVGKEGRSRWAPYH